MSSGLGDPPEGQRLLREAFHAYAEARFHPDARTKTELTFFANLLIGLHEQARLQPEITEALNAPAGLAGEMKPRILVMVLPGSWLRIRHVVARLLGRTLPLDEALDRLLDHVRAEVRRVITQALMTLRLPGGEVLHLGRDLRAEFPRSLTEIAAARVRDLLVEVDPTPDTTAGTGAQDWSRLEERMHFIADFFRAYHEQRSLFALPFTPEQVAVLKAGRRPEGRL